MRFKISTTALSLSLVAAQSHDDAPQTTTPISSSIPSSLNDASVKRQTYLASHLSNMQKKFKRSSKRVDITVDSVDAALEALSLALALRKDNGEPFTCHDNGRQHAKASSIRGGHTTNDTMKDSCPAGYECSYNGKVCIPAGWIGRLLTAKKGGDLPEVINNKPLKKTTEEPTAPEFTNTGAKPRADTAYSAAKKATGALLKKSKPAQTILTSSTSAPSMAPAVAIFDSAIDGGYKKGKVDPSPSVVPSASPSATPSFSPMTTAPSDSPTPSPTRTLTALPTSTSTAPPDISYTASFTVPPTEYPTVPSTTYPTVPPTTYPTVLPTAYPTVPPTAYPTVPPTTTPTTKPIAPLTLLPTVTPSASPTARPNEAPKRSSAQSAPSCMTGTGPEITAACLDPDNLDMTDCCIGTGACSFLTIATICSGSCNGKQACEDIAQGIKVGYNSCRNSETPKDPNRLGFACTKLAENVGDRSCHGYSACYFSHGTIDDDSCVGFYACSGTLGNIGAKSCLGSFACNLNAGHIGDDSCIAYSPGQESSCFNSSAIIGNGSCRGHYVCSNGYATAVIGDGSCNNGLRSCMGVSAAVNEDSCNGADLACSFAKAPIGSGSCNGGYGACYNNGGTIGEASCDALLACYKQAGSIGDHICNEAMECSQNTKDVGDRNLRRVMV